ncbi:MAG: hypothetical protein RLZZ59_695 [Pseudomonadota bacterium]|jgi:flagellar hook protein FlgE
MSQAMNISAGALEAFAKKRQAGASNIAQEKVTSAKGTYQGLVAQVIGGQTQGVNVVSQNRISAQGGISATNTKSNLAISGQGFFVVASDNTAIAGAGASTSAYYYQRRGDFSITDSDQILRSITGSYKLQGWKLDSQGKLPTDTSTLAGLVDISFKNLSAQATKTTKVSPIMNLSASAEKLKGPGATINLAAGNVTKSIGGSSGIIVPAVGNEDSKGTLNFGDQFQLSIPKIGDLAVTYEFGGVATSKKISAQNQMYGQSNASQQFASTAAGIPAVPGQTLEPGTQLFLTANGKTYTYTFTTASGQQATGGFNNLASLQDAINITPGLKASINDGRLYIISTVDSDKGITFTDSNAGDLVNTLGLWNVPENTVQQTKRFATLDELQKKIKLQSDIDYTAKINASGGLDFGAVDARNNLSIKPINRYQNALTKVTQGYGLTDVVNGLGTWSVKNVVTISANNHGLKAGDYVRIKGTNLGYLTDGTYLVSKVSPDAFVIGTRANIAAGANGNNIAVPNNGSSTWQKVDGGPLVQVRGAGGTQVDALTDNAKAIFTNLQGYIDTIQKFTVGDIVYITNSRILNDGYYRVINDNLNDGNSVAVTAVTGNAAPAQGNDLKAQPVNNAEADTNVVIQKVSSADNTLDPFPIEIRNGTQIVELKTNNTNYKDGDMISFEGLANAITFKGITITPGKYYKISKDNAGVITFRADGANAAEDGFIGLRQNLNAADARSSNPHEFLGENVYINNSTALLRTMGIFDPDVLQGKDLSQTYDATDSAKRFTESSVKPSVAPQTVTVYDSQGAPHNLQMAFGKLTNNVWAVEVFATAGDIKNNEIKLASGTITFGEDGQFVDTDLPKTINLDWTNGAATQDIEFNWGSQGKFDGLTQNNGATNLVSMDQDGQSVGSFIGYEINEKGIVTVQFSNGKTQDVYKIPLALAPNADGMTAVQEGLYTASNASGALLLKEMSVGGAGTVQSSALEDSTIDSATEIVGFIGSVQQAGLNSATMSKDSEAFHELLAAVKSS